MENEIEEVTLPLMIASEPFLPSVPPFRHSHTRKRPFLRSREPSSYEDQLAEAIHTSSDPALFSSDETPDAENYATGSKRRKKKTYRGTWWGTKLRKMSSGQSEFSEIPVKKRAFRRNFDSGIFMGDDSSAADLSSEGLLEQELLDAQEKDQIQEGERHVNKACDDTKSRLRAHQSFKFTTEAALRRTPQGRPMKPKDQLIRQVVQRCLDKNDENVDWTGMGIDYLPPAITDLKSMIKRIKPGMIDDGLAPFEAELKVYLGGNHFTQLPPPLLELTNIQLLSMRQNNLAQLSPGIRDLVHLQELNVSSNRLTFLPYEVFQLLRHQNLASIRHLPNPWLPIPPKKDQLGDVESLTFLTPKSVGLRRVAVSQPTEYLPGGIPIRASAVLRRANGQPHLSETVLRALLRHNTSKADLSTYLTDDHPQSVKNLVAMLHSAQSSGGHMCTFCKRSIVLPRYQWYEWWDIVYNVAENDAYFNPTSATTTSSLETTEELSESITQQEVLEEETPAPVRDRVLPFQRFACGCMDVRAGLDQELGESELFQK